MQVSESTAEPFVPSRGGLRALRDAARDCRGCDLYKSATQTVFGSGPSRARVLFVGEQPGDREDIEGEPFVGPAGGLLDLALAEAGIERDDAYLTNAVKHFKFVPQERGKRRIHRKPSTAQMRACRPWGGRRAAGGAAGDRRVPGRHRGAGADGQRLPHQQGTRCAAGLPRDRRRGTAPGIVAGHHPPLGGGAGAGPP
ncbi:DNA polymerase bacteriophage-type [Saccharopolyspora erythraea NRRL 2338]|uniref:DNA polymerase bacteriophage-type n=1 Tax=Saccharopolyspora erythraea (strain ATCC 11635 / DSM 40517 / JCM 4748 / NBRC 13426 / NCIMB 8594 / NRRL 2338) TaxID=405948 RepID=A4FHD4_SACEN|nr:DNA polymerase bacteriophage-type [Saccharopolyspora erythraea NRRL 2338]